MMNGDDHGVRIGELCFDVASGSMRYSRHYYRRLQQRRPTPNREDIRFLLCEDDPEVIEDCPNDYRGPRCLVWGTTNINGRVGHVVCGYPPDSQVITAYFPAETEPEKWDDNYRIRVGGR